MWQRSVPKSWFQSESVNELLWSVLSVVYVHTNEVWALEELTALAFHREVAILAKIGSLWRWCGEIAKERAECVSFKRQIQEWRRSYCLYFETEFGLQSTFLSRLSAFFSTNDGGRGLLFADINILGYGYHKLRLATNHHRPNSLPKIWFRVVKFVMSPFLESPTSWNKIFFILNKMN